VDADQTGVVVAPDPDAGSTWSPLCGPVSIGCLSDSDAGTCSDVDEVGLQGDADAGAADAADAASGTPLTCRIRSVSDAIVRACEPAGTGFAGAPCRAGSDCGVGLTCIIEDLESLCRPYCCADPEGCPSNTYCTTRTTLVDRDTWTLGSEVPVCSPAENCPLSDPYPCPQGQNCTCPAGKACTVVRRLGLTACVKPGTGVAGAFCPCAAGYVCSNTTFTCLKLCPLISNSQNSLTESACLAGTSCQASNDLPQDWGVCNGTPLLVN
jgi:hypothetical protein